MHIEKKCVNCISPFFTYCLCKETSNYLCHCRPPQFATANLHTFYINQNDETITWKETCIEFKKYKERERESRLWANSNKIYWDFRSAKIISLREKNVVETSLVAISDSSDVHCFDLYLINIFTKSMNSERCTDIMFKLTLYSLSVTVEDRNL